MAGIHQTLREARSLYAEALKLQEAVLASHRDLKGCVAQIQTWHESMEAFGGAGRDIDGAAQESREWLGLDDDHTESGEVEYR